MKVRCRRGFIREFGAGGGTADTKERLGSAEGTDGELTQQSTKFAHTQARESEVKILRVVGDCIRNG